jgi:hypothetical protein
LNSCARAGALASAQAATIITNISPRIARSRIIPKHINAIKCGGASAL